MLTISGNRQSGKSYALRLIAIDAAIHGKTVFYQCENRLMAREQFRNLRQQCGQLGILEQAWLANGDQHIVVRGGGGIYLDEPHGRVDVHLLDNVELTRSFYADRYVAAVHTLSDVVV